MTVAPSSANSSQVARPMPAPPPVTTATLSFRRSICAPPVLPLLRLRSGLLQPEIHCRRTTRSDPGVGVAEDGQVRPAVAVEISDVVGGSAPDRLLLVGIEQVQVVAGGALAR